MNDQMIVHIARDAFYYTMLIAGPLLLAGLIIGLIISIFQAATSISEQTLTFVPKLIVIFLVSLLMLPFMITHMKDYTIQLFNIIPTLR